MKLLTIIQTCYPIHHKNFDEMAFRLSAKVWQTAFADMDFGLVFTALQKYLLTEKYPPSISDLRYLAIKMDDPRALKTAEDAWEEVLTAIKRFGYYQQEKAFETLDAPTKRIIKSMGWGEICRSEKIGIVKSNFVKAWDNVTQTQRESDLIPLEILERVKDFQQKRLDNENASS